MGGLFSGPKTTTTSTNTGSFNQQQQGSQQFQQQGSQTGQQQSTNQTQSTSTTNPNLPSWYNPLLQGVAQGYQGINQQLSQLAGKPLYGAPQQANFENQLNTSTDAASKALLSSLASRGALNSSNAAQMQTQLQLGKIGQEANYQAQIPQLNAQFLQSVLGQQGNLLANAGNIRPLVGQTTTSNSQSLSDVLSQLLNQSSGGSQTQQNSSGTSSSGGTQTSQQSGGLMDSLLGGILGGGMSLLTGGLSNLAGGGSFFGGGGGASPASTAPSFNPASTAPSTPPSLYQPTSYNPYQPTSSSQIFNQMYGPAGQLGPSWG